MRRAENQIERLKAGGARLSHHAVEHQTVAASAGGKLNIESLNPTPNAAMSAAVPSDEAARLAALQRYDILDTPPEAGFDRVTRLAAQLFDVPIALVSLVDADRQWFKSCYGLDARQTSREISFCAHAILSDEIFVVPDAIQDERFAGNPLVTGEAGIRFYAGAPLKTRAGFNLGSLCIIDTKPRQFSEQQLAGLTDLAALVVDELELRQSERELQSEIVERKNNEERLRLLELAVVNANDAILITEAEPIDEPGPRILYVNEAFTAMTGYSREEVIGQTPRILQGPDSDRAALDEIRAALEKWQPVRVELLNYRKDGTPFWEELSIVPVADENGWFTHWVSVQRDITDYKRDEQALQAAKAEAERANRAKSEFLSRMSHELRTPMNAILGFAQLLEMDELQDEQRQGVGEILKGGRHLLDLINEVLDIARIEAGRLAISLEPVPVGEVVQEVMALVQPLAAQRDVHFENNIVPGNCHVMADRQRLKQVVLNLLSNAVKYNREGGEVRLSCGPRDNLRIRIEISDTGPGIAPEGLEKLFVPFERLDAEEKGVEGAGIGLSICQRLVEVMNGKIGVQSIEQEGSKFWIEFPAATDPVQAVENAPPTLPVDQAATAQRAPRTVLYIEDNLSNFKLIERILARHPEIELLAAMQGQQGLELAREQQPDLILLDLHLPDINGDEVLRLLHEDANTHEIPVIMVSADATPNQIERLKAQGARDYLTKPLDIKRFLEVVEENLTGF